MNLPYANSWWLPNTAETEWQASCMMNYLEAGANEPPNCLLKSRTWQPRRPIGVGDGTRSRTINRSQTRRTTIHSRLYCKTRLDPQAQAPGLLPSYESLGLGESVGQWWYWRNGSNGPQGRAASASSARMCATWVRPAPPTPTGGA